MELRISEKARSISSSPTLAIDSKFKQMKNQGIPVVGFGAGEPDFNTPEHIKQAGIQAIDANFTRYTPASGTLELKNAVCEKMKRDTGLDYTPANVIICNGGKHALTNAFMAILNPGDEVLIPAPYWVSYPEMVKMADGVSVFIPTTEETQFKFTMDQLEAALSPKTKALVLNTPSNPTGMIYNREELEQIAAFAVEHQIYVVFDEIYEKLTYEGEHINIATLGEDIRKQTIIINGVAKTYAMTGWRIGYAVAEAPIIKAMGNMQSHATSNPNSIAQSAALTALRGNQSFIAEMRAEYIKRRDYMVKRINSIPGLSCLNPHGAFYIFMNVKEQLGKEHYGRVIHTAQELCEDILDRALVAMVPSEGFGIEGYVRLSYATSMEVITAGLDRIEEYLQGKSGKIVYTDDATN